MDGEALFWLELALALPALVAALALKPWRMLHGPLLTPTLAALALLPWFWLLPQQLPQGLQVQLSGASLLALMLGWPLAVPVLALVALQVWALGLHDAPTVLSQWVWLGLVPATLALGWVPCCGAGCQPIPSSTRSGAASSALRWRCSAPACCRSSRSAGWWARAWMTRWWRAG